MGTNKLVSVKSAGMAPGLLRAQQSAQIQARYEDAELDINNVVTDLERESKRRARSSKQPTFSDLNVDDRA